MTERCSGGVVVIAALIASLGPAAAVAQGTIEGTVTFWGDSGTGTQVEVAAHQQLLGPPDANTFVALPGGAYSIPVADGTYYIAALMSPDGVFGEPRSKDVLAWYDGDGDGDPDTVTVSGGAASGIDIDLGFVYVDIDATGANDGSSWVNAFTDLQNGIDLAVPGIEVWAAEGTYVPGANRSDSFVAKAGVRVYGGFAGGETSRLGRDWNAHPTILSGEIGTAAATDNCYHVVRADGANTSAMLNGLTITRGYANGAGNDGHGGGVRAVGGGISLVNVSLSDNYAGQYGGGIYTDSPATVYAVNCRFQGNQAVMHGGGASIDAAAPTPSVVLNGVFTGNAAWRGGGIAVEGQVFAPGLQPQLVNLSLSGNSAGGEGGGIFTNTTTYSPPGGAPIHVDNCILWGNTGPNPQISFFGGTDQPVVSYSLVQGGWAGPGSNNLSSDPSFADGELRLTLDSPAIDAADCTLIPQDIVDLDEDHFTDHPTEKDLDMNWRRENMPHVPDTGVPDDEGRTPDMGAYETVDPALIFWNGFESGGTDEWQVTVP
ncbi:MAG TPA: hypothetical protein VLT32_06035 [Candidatus Sulfomarinibacteraceae bacterium]|nr:hypothetical protein [Candidatus Sulfomarinibacteraceae bacterium]